MTRARRHIWLCADDYGISPGVNRGIIELIDRERLNATSVMVLAPSCTAADAVALRAAAARHPRCAIGLHVTLTAPFRPLTLVRPTEGDAFLPLSRVLMLALLRRFDAALFATEIAAQLSRFTELFGRAPDFVDGHQHVQLFPQIRDAFVEAVKAAAPQAWVRQGGRTISFAARLRSPKALLLDALSAGFRRRARAAGLAMNTAFAGAYDFADDADFENLTRRFLGELPDGGLMMCHPGHPDAELAALDPVTAPRAREYAYFSSEAFARLLAAENVSLV